MEESQASGAAALGQSWSGTMMCCRRYGDSSGAMFNSVFEEHHAMILGMNQKALLERRPWCVYLWMQGHHWAVVLQPLGTPFQARVVDDFVHGATHCYSAELPSSRLFLVYELLLDPSSFFLMLSAKTDFRPDHKQVQRLGQIGPLTFEEISGTAMGVVRSYRSYSIVGSNCQHFVADFVLKLGSPCGVVPEDEEVLRQASDGAIVAGVSGAAVATSAFAGAAGAAALVAGSAAPATSVLAAAPLALSLVAVGAGAVGGISVLTLVTLSLGYRVLRAALRESDEGKAEPQ
mmetsp:Transcript_39549/g.93098  ORF Transcript_39549/g.93098 Transcript_39549/m.93098 type:complete len:290 (+) Transcript_39549:86-955(+)